VFVVRVCEGQYREELILNIILFIVRVWEWQYRQELILNIIVFFCEVLGRAIYKRTDTEYYYV